MSRKTERLVNLTIALLATKRYLTKSEIFRTVDGYEGTPESKERMFERDKDDLRNLGIIIEVGTFDPLFEDESGYRIKPENYRFQLGALNSREIAVLSLSAEAWRGAALSSSALSALVKLNAMGIESDLEILPEFSPAILSKDENLAIAISAITSRTCISFTYLNQELNQESRALEPYAVVSKYGHWYLSGNDLDRKDLRSFRLDRIFGPILTKGRPSSFEIPTSFSAGAQVIELAAKEVAQILLRDGRALGLRKKATEIAGSNAPAGWRLFEVALDDRERFIEEVLWYGEDAIVTLPDDLRGEIIRRLKEGLQRYGG